MGVPLILLKHDHRAITVVVIEEASDLLRERKFSQDQILDGYENAGSYFLIMKSNRGTLADAHKDCFVHLHYIIARTLRVKTSFPSEG